MTTLQSPRITTADTRTTCPDNRTVCPDTHTARWYRPWTCEAGEEVAVLLDTIMDVLQRLRVRLDAIIGRNRGAGR